MKFARRGRCVRAIVVSAALAALIPSVVEAGPGSSGQTERALIERGRDLFLNETFDGNGRTCGTCHPATNNFTLDPAFIATLPDDDPLFVAETNPDLAELEDSRALRQRALFRENVDGFDRPAVLRGVPHTLGLPVSIAPEADEDTNQSFADGRKPVHALGWTADGAPGDGSLREFARGAIVQHLTKTMNRVEGVDFRLPTDAELDALEAFQRSLGRQDEVDLAALTFLDDAAERGKDLFDGVGVNRSCSACHADAGANVVDDETPNEAFNNNFDTGTRQLGIGPKEGGFGQDHLDGVPGFGNGTINTPSLVEAADTAPFFHNNSAATLEDSIRFYTTPTFARSPSGSRGVFVLNDAAIADIAAFLRALNARENAGSALVGLVAARRERNSERLPEVVAEIEDGIEVLQASDLAPDAVAAFREAAGLISGADTPPAGALGQAQAILRGIPPMIALESETVAGN